MEDKPVQNPQHHHGPNPLGAIILIFFGSLFLLNNFNIVPMSVWRDIWKLWPIVLILWGLQLIFGKSQLAIILVFLFGVALSLLLFPYLNNWIH